VETVEGMVVKNHPVEVENKKKAASGFSPSAAGPT
jgi:hypothetical protein